MQAPPPEAILMELGTAYWLSRAIATAARFDLADAVKDGPKSAAEIASERGLHADNTFRLLRALAAYGIFEQHPDGRFASNAIAATFEKGAPMYAPMRSLVGGDHWAAWGNLEHGIRTGENPFDAHFGMDCWKYYAQHPEVQAEFDAAMTGYSNSVLPAILEAYDFSRFTHILDIAGGHGAVLNAILDAAPNAQGTLFDQPHVVEKASVKRAAKVGGSFFDEVPAGGDCYVMKFILHDWKDADCLRILATVRRAIAPNGKLVLLETVLLPPNQRDWGKLLDLNMLAIPGGRERDEVEWRALLAAGGFRLDRVVPTKSPVSVIESSPI
ncbi:MAG: methyltransferase [Bryobacteraceae bacterium]|nr:methyltransferase [Bryobacteraceae bacterium]